MSYTRNQFYNLNSFEPFKDTTSRTAESNPPFIWPPNSLRNSVTGKSTTIQRGYLRLMSELFGGDKAKNLSTRRLHFQFNPDSISRSVAARNDIQLWFNMDPAQLTQPIPGDANFAFELLFNREAEVNSAPVEGTGQRQSDILKRVGSGGFDVGSTTNGIYQYNVADVGVLADLIVFDELVGQGINRGLLDDLVERARLGSVYTQSQESTQTEGTQDEEDIPPQTQSFNATDTRNILEANWGNSAFLISQPIRVVFSSLFMVEGYVTQTSVLFNKFTPTMVPVQASVGVQMQAMYIGFGKKSTFFEFAFQQNEEEVKKVDAKVTAETKAINALGDRLFKKIIPISATAPNIPRAAVLSVRELLDRQDPFSGTALNENAVTALKAITLRSSDALRTELSERKAIRSIMPSASCKIKYLGNSVPGNVPVGVTTDTEWDLLVSFDAPLNLKDLDNTKDQPDDTMEMRIETLSPQGVSYIFDNSSTSQYSIELVVNFTVTSVTGATTEAKQNIKFTKENMSWTDYVVFGADTTFSTREN